MLFDDYKLLTDEVWLFEFRCNIMKLYFIKQVLYDCCFEYKCDILLKKSMIIDIYIYIYICRWGRRVLQMVSCGYIWWVILISWRYKDFVPVVVMLLLVTVNNEYYTIVWRSWLCWLCWCHHKGDTTIWMELLIFCWIFDMYIYMGMKLCKWLVLRTLLRW